MTNILLNKSTKPSYLAWLKETEESVTTSDGKQVGAIPIALTRGEGKRNSLIDAGAAYLITTDTQDIVSEVNRITNNQGARVTFDPVGGPNFEKLVMAAAIKGILIAYGALSGEVTPLAFLHVLGKSLTVKGYQLTEYTTDLIAIERG